MIEVPGTAGRFFKALGEAGINVILISQASSEHSICIAVDPQRAAAARDVVNAEFARERAAGLVDDLVVEEDVSILAIVGVDMCQRPGISGRIFGSLGAAGVNVRAIAQGSSELNISLAIASADERRALATVHDAFFDPTRLNVFLLGVGTVGGELLRQLRESTGGGGLEPLRHRVEPPHEPRAPPARPRALVERAPRRRRREYHRPRGARRIRALDTGPERAGRLHRERRDGRPLRRAARRRHRRGDGEQEAAGGTASRRGSGCSTRRRRPGRDGSTTRRPSAPVYRWCARSPTRSRPAIACIRIEGLFSGTLSFLLHRLAAGASRSARRSPRRARAGFTEPDVRDDLSGQDVARKLLILARLAGRGSTSATSASRRFCPKVAASREATPDEVWRRLPELDSTFAELVAECARENRVARVSRFVRRWTGGAPRATVGIERVPLDHPAASAIGTENLFAFTTERYRERPLVVRGPGAGPAVTAAGVFGDLLAVAARTSHGGGALPRAAAASAAAANREPVHGRRRRQRAMSVAARARTVRARERVAPRATAFAPATVSNVACGFDVLGFAVATVGDRVTATVTSRPGVSISRIGGAKGTITLDARSPTARESPPPRCSKARRSRAAGSSSRSKRGSRRAAGWGRAPPARSRRWSRPTPRSGSVCRCRACSRSRSRASASPRAASSTATTWRPASTAAWSRCAASIRSTSSRSRCPTVCAARWCDRTSRSRPASRARCSGNAIPLSTAVVQWANLAGLVAGLFRGDWDLIARSLEDVVAEPVRGHQVPAFREMKQAALDAGALGCEPLGLGSRRLRAVPRHRERGARRAGDAERAHACRGHRRRSLRLRGRWPRRAAGGRRQCG